MRLVSVPVQVQSVLGDVVNNIARLVGRQKTDDGTIAEEAQISVVRDNVDGTTAPSGLVRGGLTAADVVDSADVDAVETNARTVAEHGLPGGVDGRREGAGNEQLLGLSPGLKVADGNKGPVFLVLVLDHVFKGIPLEGEAPMVEHAGKAEFVIQADIPPDSLLRGDEVSEAFTNKGKAREVRNVLDGDILEDVDEKFVG